MSSRSATDGSRSAAGAAWLVRLPKRVRCARGSMSKWRKTRGAATDAALLGEISRFSISTVCDKRELFWPRRFFNFRLKEIARIVGRYVAPRHGAGARPVELP